MDRVKGKAEPMTPSKTAINMDHVLIEPKIALRVPASVAMRRQVLPITEQENRVFVACAQEDTQTLGLIQRYFRHPVEFKLAEAVSLRRALDRVYGNLHIQDNPLLVDFRITTEETQQILRDADVELATSLSEELLRAAILRKASDIHIIPQEKSLQVDLRVDGKLEEYRQITKNYYAGLISRFKVLGGMDISEKRAPQDGSFCYQAGSQKYDIRVATLPALYGEKMTLRFLSIVDLDFYHLEQLGMNETHLQMYDRLLQQSNGLVLLSGPTGSGKTTTLYATIQELLRREKLNIITVEDPIEYRIPKITQVKVESGDRVTFSKALRSLLRHDPDVVVIGEIRDQETAEVAMKAALTGHLVFSTIHTNSAVGAITRLVDMGIPRYLISATLKASLAQRLVRKSCTFCQKEIPLQPEEAQLLKITHSSSQKRYQAQGCVYCLNLGYSGRIGLFEFLVMEASWNKLLLEGAGEDLFFQQMETKGVPVLLQDGASKILQGKTTLEEVIRVLSL